MSCKFFPVLIIASLPGIGQLCGELVVVENPGQNVGPDATVAVESSSLGGGNFFSNAVISGNGQWGEFMIVEEPLNRLFFRANETAPLPHLSLQLDSSEEFNFFISFFGSLDYPSGGELGTDNWLYVTSLTGTKSWVQVELNAQSFVPLRYVWDDETPVGHITLPNAVAAVEGATPSSRDVQFRSIDLVNEVIELRNYGSSTVDLTGWRFCSHNEDVAFRYTSASGLNGESIAAGESLFIHLNNDALSGGNALNRSSLGGSFAVPMTSAAYAVGIYFPDGGSISFGSASDLGDHIQWSTDGVDNESADARSGTAEGAGLWSSQSSWIETSSMTESITLTDRHNGRLHGPSDYLTLPDFYRSVCIEYQSETSGVAIAFDQLNDLVLEVQRSTGLQPTGWTALEQTAFRGFFLQNQTEEASFYRLVPQIP